MPPRLTNDPQRLAETRRKAHEDFLAVVAADIKDLRDAAGVTQAQVGATLGFSSRWLSKIERAEADMTFFDYLNLIAFFQEANPEHPALGLLSVYMPKKRTMGK